MSTNATAKKVFPGVERAKKLVRELDKLKSQFFDDESLLFVDVEESEITLSGAIGTQPGEISAARFIAGLREMEGKPTTLLLNSPGGSVDESVEIFNAIERHGKCDVIVTSLAASAASYILQAGRRRMIFENSTLMLHHPWTRTTGDAEAHRKEAEVLDKYSARLISAYASRSGKTKDEIREILKGETWYVGEEIIDAGFADGFVAKQSRSYLHLPKDVAAKIRRADKLVQESRDFQTQVAASIRAKNRQRITMAKIAIARALYW